MPRGLARAGLQARLQLHEIVLIGADEGKNVFRRGGRPRVLEQQQVAQTAAIKGDLGIEDIGDHRDGRRLHQLFFGCVGPAAGDV